MQCPFCSQNIPINQQYCPHCGKKLEMEFENIEISVAADAAARRGKLVEKLLTNLIGALVVTWVFVALYNDYYRQTAFPTELSASVCFPAPAPEVKRPGSLSPEIKPETIAVPEVPRVEPRGMSWRRDPLKSKLREAQAGDQVREVTASVAKGLNYLKGRQQRDGGWLVSGTEEGGNVVADWGRYGVTGLACLAILADGHAWNADGTPTDDPYALTVRQGINFLTAHQDESGLIGPKTAPGGVAPHYMYNQGMATAALAEAYAMTGEPYLRTAAQKAVNFILGAQQPSGGWDYYAEPAGRADTSVTVWQVMALCSAQQAGLNVPPLAFEKSLGFLDSVTDPETFRVGYDKRWTSADRGVDYGRTAIGLMLQLQLGRSPSSAAVRRQVRILFGDKPPLFDKTWKPAERVDKMDYYYLYHGTLAMYRLGGKDWEIWNRLLVKTLVDSQDQGGSWSADRWTKEGGKIYATALATMCLEVYYRYQ